MDPLHPLLGRTLVLIAHPDDETAGCGILLQRMQEPIIAFATDGAPRSSSFWSAFGSRANYATLRWSEAERALAHAGVNHLHQLSEWNPIADQELFLDLEYAYKSLSSLVEDERPDAILTLAYEGGHPDHDCCAFLASFAGTMYELPVWEMPLYNRASGVLTHQSFIDEEGISVEPTAQELSRKFKMLAAYRSQEQILADFSAETERVRPAEKYDFSQSPHPGVLNYEAWSWPMHGADLCCAFSSFLTHASESGRKSKWKSAA